MIYRPIRVLTAATAMLCVINGSLIAAKAATKLSYPYVNTVNYNIKKVTTQQLIDALKARVKIVHC